MNSDDWKNVKSLLDEALNLPAGDRLEFLRKSAAAPEIVAEAESLLALETDETGMLDRSAMEMSDGFFPAETGAEGQTVGPYRIVGELGAGGMGAVFLAERADGEYTRQVAVKLLRRELNTASLRRRFQAEREILASLNHPNIARLLDAGTTSDGVPFIVMEFVDGRPIDVYCAEECHGVDARLEIFGKVCEAVAYAHRSLVVHRDLKPSNILVTPDGIPKLLDFGISKLVGAEVDAGVATVTRLGVMTPSYASPEQLRGASVSTATDIYSLGVILYELLSGSRPFGTAEGDETEIVRAVAEREPERPSAVAARLLPARETGSRLVPATNPRQIEGDLDNIVLKALRKEPERRYLSVDGFADDITRHRRGLPVLARPNTFAYRAGKFINRNRIGVAAAVLLVVAIAAGIGATLWQARVARGERARAEKRFNDVRKLANSYIFDVFPEIEDLEGSLKARELIISTALQYLDSLAAESSGDAGLQLEVATAYERIGDVQGTVSISNKGDIQAGLESYRKAQALREAVAAANPSDAKNMEALSRNYQGQAGTLLWNIDTAAASVLFEKAISIRRRLVAANPASADLQNRLAVLLTDFGAVAVTNVENDVAAARLDEAEKILSATLAANPEHYYTRKAYPRYLRALAALKINRGDFDGATTDIDAAVARTAELIKVKADDESLVRSQWVNESLYCTVALARGGDSREAVAKCEPMTEFPAKRLEKSPDEAFSLFDLGTSHLSVMQARRRAGQFAPALESGAKALEPFAKLDKMSPSTNDYERAIAAIRNESAETFFELKRADDAAKAAADACDLMEKVVARDPTVTSYRVELAEFYVTAAKISRAAGNASAADELLARAREIVNAVAASGKLRFQDQELAKAVK